MSSSKNAAHTIVTLILLVLVLFLGWRERTTSLKVTNFKDSIEEKLLTCESDLNTVASKLRTAKTTYKQPILRKKIDQKNYTFLYRDTNDWNSNRQRILEVYDLNLKGMDSFIKNNSFHIAVQSYINSFTQDFWIDEDNNQLYLIQGNNNTNDLFNYIIQVTFEDTDDYFQATSSEVLYVQKKEPWESVSIILHDKKTNQLLLDTSSGEGCGATGELWTLHTYLKNKSTITEYSSGCVLEPALRYGGIINDKIILATISSDSAYPEYENEGWYKNTSLFLIDPFTKKRTTLINDSEKLTSFFLVNNEYNEQTIYKNRQVKFENKIVFRTLPSLDNDGENYLFYDRETNSFFNVDE